MTRRAAPARWITVSPSAEQFEAEYAGADALSTEVIINAVRVGDQLTGRVNDYVRARGLPSATAFVALEVLRGADRPLMPSELADAMFVARGTMTGLLDTLERRGLVRRSVNPDNRRTMLVEILEPARVIMDDLVRELHPDEVEWTKVLTAAEKRTLLRLLGKLESHLSASADAEPTG